MWSPGVAPHARLVRAAVGGAVLSWQPLDGDGEPANPGTVTVTVTRADGTTLKTAGTATSGTASAPRTVALTAAELADLDMLTVTWTASGVTMATDVVEIAGRPFVTVAEVRAADSAVDDVRYPNDVVRDKIIETEREFERICGGALVPRFRVAELYGANRPGLTLPDMRLRRVRWARIWAGDGTYSELTDGQLDAIPAATDGVARRTDGAIWPRVRITVAYEAGYDTLPADLRRVALARVADLLFGRNSGMPSAIASASGGDQTFTFRAPGTFGNWTGSEEIDAVLRGYAEPESAL